MKFTDLFREIGDPWPEAFLILTTEGRILALNEAGEKMLGLNRKKGTGLLLTEFTLDQDDHVLPYLMTCAANRQQVPGSVTIRKKDGQPIRHICFGFRVRPEPQGPPAVFLRCTPAHSATNRFMALNRQLEEQQLAHLDLKSAHARLKAVLDSLEAIVYVADMETYEVLFINKYCRDLLGEITGTVCWKSIQEGQSGPCAFCTNKYLLSPDGSAGNAYKWEFQNTINKRWYFILDRAIPWVDGRVVRLEIATDITEAKEAEARRILNAERIESLLSLSQAVWKSKSALVNYALEEAVRLTGSTVGYLHSLQEDQQTIDLFSWSSGVVDQCSSANLQHYSLDKAGIWADSVRLRQPVIHNDYPNIPNRKGFPEGHYPIQRHMSVPVFDGETIVAIAGVGNKETPYDQEDIQQLILFMHSTWAILKQKQTELAVKHAKEKWEETFNATDLAITIHSPNMRIVQANRAAGDLFDVEPAALVGQYCYKIFHDGAEPCTDCPELQTLADHKSHQAIIRHEKLGKTFEVITSPLMDDEGTLQGCIHIAKDVTESKLLESKLQQAYKMEALGTMAGGIAHDFNNILTPILGYTELTMNNMVSPSDPAALCLKAIHKAGLRAKDLVQQILTFSRQSAHEKKPLQPHLVIRETLKLLRSSFPTTIEIRVDIPKDCGMILGDPTQLQQIVMNLCTNAYHAMREKGGVLGIVLKQVDISEKDSKVMGLEISAGPYVEIEVSDTGCGMDSQTMAKIFEPYFTTKKMGEGTGLGLSIIHGIVKSCEGHITVYSEPGQGTTFHVYLPRLVVEPMAAGDVLRDPLPVGNERLLVIDDEESITDMLYAVLTGLEYQVTICNKSENALGLFQKNPADFDLIITDMTMPHLTGLDLIKEVLEIRPDMPVLLCTGFSELINKEKAAALGIRGFLMKPVATRELAQAIRKALVARE